MTSRQLPQPPAAVAVHHRRQSRKLLLATIAAFPSVIFLLLLLLLLCLCLSRRRRRPHTLLFDSPDSPSPSGHRRFSYRELDAATSGFAASRSLGRGASAAVFLGILANGKSVAVKRLELPSGEREFLNELQMLSNLNHSAFVVPLLGHCFDGDRRRLLVYEHMSNGSLQHLFFGPRRQLLDWNRRFQIILDLAKAIAFLHLSDPPIIHGDIKPSNVLLCHDFRAKLADFGLSRRKTESEAPAAAELFRRVDIAMPIRHRGDNKKKKKKKSRSVSDETAIGEAFSEERSVRGTVCYIAPECSGCGKLTEKADIYNLGVLILVIVSGRRPLQVLESPVKVGRANLISWCRRVAVAQRGDVLEIVDENLRDSYNRDQVRLCVNVALLCLQRMPDVRPDSWDIVKVLEGERDLPEVPF